MQSTMPIGWTRGFCCRTAGWGIAWIGLEVTGREMISWAWRAIGGRHGQECLGGRWVAPMAWPGTDEHQEGKHRWPEPASGPHCLSRLTPTGQRGISVDGLIWREKNTIVISPHSLHFETEYPFDFSPSNARTNCNARNQIPIPGQRETGSANNTRMSHTNDETRVRRPSGRGQPTTRLPSRRVWADSFFFALLPCGVCVCVSGGEWSPPVWVWLFCAARPPVFFLLTGTGLRVCV